MQEFFMDYGLWLLVGLLIIIGLVFLLSGKSKDTDGISTATAPEPTATIAEAQPVDPVTIPVTPVPPIEAVIVEPLVIEPLVVEPLAVEPNSAIATPATGANDDLLRIKGIGPKLNILLLDLGVTRFAQIAAWTDSDIAAIDPKLGNFNGRPVRDQWVDQAKYLAASDIAGFEAKYGKL